MSIDQAKLDRIKASLAYHAKAEGVTPGPWSYRKAYFDRDEPARRAAYEVYPHIDGLKRPADGIGDWSALAECGSYEPKNKANAAFIARARTTAPAMAKMMLDEILWLERMMRGDEDYEITFGLFHDRLASIVNGWPEETL